jgi:hypothetical protein
VKKSWFALLSALALLFSLGISSAGAETDRDCGEFGSKEEVMEFWHSNGYSATNDPHDLDRDADGLPCEVSKGEYDSYVASKEDSSEEPADEASEESTEEESESTEESSAPAATVEKKDDSGTKSESGEKMPDTATNNVPMMAASVALVLTGAMLFIRKKQTN